MIELASHKFKLLEVVTTQHYVVQPVKFEGKGTEEIGTQRSVNGALAILN